MSFKLLAIRPIKDCDSGILKGLVPNCIYQFYNEYDFYYKQNSETEELQSYIEYQERNLIDKSKKKDLALIYKSIEAIKKTEIVPHGLFGTNINISAIVGQNGSGKSSILELFYYLMYKYATEHNLVINKKDFKSNRKLEVEVFFEDENYNIIIHRYTEQEDFLGVFDLKHKDLLYLSDSKYSNFLNYQCYSIALNYSIYGLNSHVTGNWLDALFHKNDGYRTPIVINPYRENGNIDINNEYILAQSRLLLSYYLINKKSLLEDVQISTVEFQLEILKHQFITRYDEMTEQNIKVSLSEIYKELIRKNSFFYDNLTKEREVNLLVKKILEEDIIIDYDKDHFIFRNSIEFKNFNIEHVEFKLLNILYILKKIYKITQNYKEYEVFKQLFVQNKDESKDHPDISQKTINVNIRELTKIYTDYFYRIFRNLLEEYFKEQEIEYIDLSLLSKNDKLKLISFLEKVDNRFLKKIHIRSLDNFHSYFDIILHGYFDIIENGYLDVRNTNIKNRNLISFIFNSVIHNINSKEVTDLRDLIYSSVDYIFTRDNSRKSFQLDFNEMKNLLFLKLYTDESHITFKLKQAISYFEKGFFENIKGYVWDDVLKQFSIELNQQYLENQSINTIPLAFVQPMVMVVKTKETNEQIIRKLINDNKLSEYPFNELSSGEQQLIHSILTVIYHLYNLKSIDGLHKQTYINLIFDEIELYFHPEYQRIYVSNLIKALKDIDKKEVLKFNILLSTHSPFILSDIPSQNTLKLKEGVPVKDSNRLNSFGANIHDLLSDEFFMNNGFVGKHAYDKIAITLNWLKIKANEINQSKEYSYDIDNNIELINFNSPEDEYNYHRNIIELIGEPLVKNKLRTMFLKLEENDPSFLKDELEKARLRVFELEKKLSNA